METLEKIIENEVPSVANEYGVTEFIKLIKLRLVG